MTFSSSPAGSFSARSAVLRKPLACPSFRTRMFRVHKVVKNGQLDLMCLLSLLCLRLLLCSATDTRLPFEYMCQRLRKIACGKRNENSFRSSYYVDDSQMLLYDNGCVEIPLESGMLASNKLALSV